MPIARLSVFGAIANNRDGAIVLAGTPSAGTGLEAGHIPGLNPGFNSELGVGCHEDRGYYLQ